MTTFQLPDTTHIGAAHLRVIDLDRALAFYRDLLGLHEIEREGSTVTLAADTAPLIRLTGQPDASPRPPHTTGLYHVAIRLPDRPALARLLQRLLDQRYPLQGAADHAVSEAIYLPDPDGNGLELYTDRPHDHWEWVNDQVSMSTDPLDVENLLAQVGPAPWTGIDPGTDIGHMHLNVADLERAEAFYHGLLGLDVMQRTYSGALFMAAGGYHHHLGVNIWAGQGAPAPPADAVGLIEFGLVVPGAAWDALIERVRTENGPVEAVGPGRVLVHDPDQIGVILAQSN